jgi:phosphoribosylformylglycinamidine synthase
MPLGVLLGKPPRMQRQVNRISPVREPLKLGKIDLKEAVQRVLRLPTVGDKSFLITIGDRTVGGLVVRDQMVGPWQVPVADVAVTASDFTSYHGEAMAMGERTPLAVLDGPASGRMAVGEAITNIAAAAIDNLSAVCLSANWMAAAGHPGEDAALFDTVRAVALELCPALGIAIPVGKDSLSMQTVWRQQEKQHRVTAPLSLIVSAFAPVYEVQATLTPQLRTDQGPSELLLIDLGRSKNRLGGSALAQVFNQLGEVPPDLNDPGDLKAFFELIQRLNAAGQILAYHDRSDGGLLVTLCEMLFAGGVGVTVSLDTLGKDPLAILFSEELGAVIQISASERGNVLQALKVAGFADCSHVLGSLNTSNRLIVTYHDKTLLDERRVTLRRLWSETSFRMQSLRDNPGCAQEAFDALLDENDPGLNVQLTFDPEDDIAAPFISRGERPQVAILREQGINGQVEMAAAFEQAGFAAIDVHMSDLTEGRISLKTFQGIVACGGFSYGDVLGAGQGWAKSILFNQRVREEFAAFFARANSFGLGVCNGCQLFSNLRELIPGTDLWPHFATNRVEQFEARLVAVEVLPTPSLFFADMAGSHLPIPVAHGEGQVVYHTDDRFAELQGSSLVALRYVDNAGRPTNTYPANPNGSFQGITGLSNRDGRFTIMMPHPERVFRTVQFSWYPQNWNEYSPWLRLFRNARVWLG